MNTMGRSRTANGAGRGPGSAVDAGLIILTALGGVPDVLRELKVDPVAALASLGINPRGLGEPGSTVSYAAMGRLFTRCVALSGCPHFGLLAGARVGLSSLGAVGFLVRHSPDVGTALRNLIAFMRQNQRGAVPTFRTDGDSAKLGYLIYLRDIESTEQIYDGALACCGNILRELCGPAFRPSRVVLSRARPADPLPYDQIFAAPVHFETGEDSIAFPAAWLAQPVPRADPMLYRVLLAQVQDGEPGVASGFVATLRGVLRARLIAGRCSADEVARLFGCHRRTLHRRLQAEGLTFEGLVEAVRYELAREFLGDARNSLGQIASTLGYADTSAFSRAFRRWSATTPTRWRARAGRDRSDSGNLVD